MLNDKLKDVALELLIFLFSLAALVKIVIHVSNVPTNSLVNFATFPIIITTLMVILMIIKLTGTFSSISRLRSKSQTSTNDERDDRSTLELGNVLHSKGLIYIRTFGTVVFCAAYAFLLSKVNFFALTFVFLIIMLLLYGIKGLVKIPILSVGGALGVYFIFVIFLKLPL